MTTSPHARRSASRGPAPTPTMTVRGAADLLTAVPYLIGFHPRESLVLVGLRESMLVVTVRIDLLDLAEGTVLADALGAMRRGGAERVVAAVYDDDPGPRSGERLPWDGAARLVADECDRAGCPVLDTFLVSGGRWCSYTCVDPACCPPEGRALPPGTTEFEAAATYAGLVALPDRESLVAVLAPRPRAERDRLLPLLAECENDAVRAVLDGGGGRHDRALKRSLFAAARASDALDDVPAAAPDDRAAARFGAALTSIPLRDAVWMAVDDHRLDGRPLWRELAARLPPPYDAAPLFLFGWRSWRAGNGALAGAAVERALDSDPGYSAADLLLAALRRGVDPAGLPRLRLPRSA